MPTGDDGANDITIVYGPAALNARRVSVRDSSGALPPGGAASPSEGAAVGTGQTTTSQHGSVPDDAAQNLIDPITLVRAPVSSRSETLPKGRRPDDYDLLPLQLQLVVARTLCLTTARGGRRRSVSPMDSAGLRGCGPAGSFT